MKEKLIITAGNNGDRSVGIPPLDIKITIEGNIDMEAVKADIAYKDNWQAFCKDVQNLLLWIDDMTCEVDTVDSIKEEK